MIFNAEIISSAVILFFVLDSLGVVPILLTLLQDIEPQRRWKIIIRELLIALAILLIFLFFGKNLLSILQLESESVSIAGGIILFIIGIKMVFPSRHGSMGPNLEGEPLVVPLAIPLIAGPSALATLILFVNSDPNAMIDWLVVLLIAWGLTAIVLLSAPILYKILRKRGLAAVERLMGMILIMISVQMLVNGIKSVI